MSDSPLLAIENLAVDFQTERGIVNAVSDVSLEVRAGECLAVVGESGSGKSQMFLACLGLLAANGRARGSARFEGQELIGATERGLGAVRGRRIGMIFQDPVNALTPHLRIGRQMTELLVDRGLLGSAQARQRALQMLQAVGVGDPDSRLEQYPYELSGGQQQRVAIAMALMAGPALLIADEPTTALDVTVQAQVLELLGTARREDLALVLITHDLGVVANLADRVAVMYAGRLVEVAAARALYACPAHPYAAGLLASVPRIGGPRPARLASVEGQPPGPHERPEGCAFAPRCFAARQICRTRRPSLRDHAGTRVACHAPLPGGWME